MESPRPQHARLIVILGPTAGGKSQLAAHLAARLGGEVISADSMQVYRRLDAGTAKPGSALRALAPHHLIDAVEPTEPFAVADWLAAAEPLIDGLLAAGRCPVVVGGTNLYIRALLQGMFEGPPADRSLRAEFAALEPAELHRRLSAVDPQAARRLAPNDRRRLTRALEVHSLTGRPISDWQRQWDENPDRPYRRDPLLLGLAWPTEAINRRINHRVKVMFDPGADPDAAAELLPAGESLPDETARLETEGALGLQAREALGYKQVLEHLTGRCSLDDARERTKVLTRRLGKQQRTWLRRFRGVQWLDAAEQTPNRRLETAWLAVREAEIGPRS